MQKLPKQFVRTILTLTLACFLLTPVAAHTGSGIAVDRIGQIYFLDTGSGLWMIDRQGKPVRTSETRFHWLAIDANDRFANSQMPSGPLGDILKVGVNPTLLLSSDFPIAIGEDENLYYPSGSAGGLRIVRMTPSGVVSVLAALPSTARGPLPHINGIAAGPDCSLYYTENDVIRRISAEGRVSMVATIRALAGGPSIPGTNEHPHLRGLAVDARGVIYVADNGDARVLRITPDGRVITLLQLQSPLVTYGHRSFRKGSVCAGVSAHIQGRAPRLDASHQEVGIRRDEHGHHERRANAGRPRVGKAVSFLNPKRSATKLKYLNDYHF